MGLHIGKDVVIFVAEGKRSSSVPLKVLFDIEKGEEEFIKGIEDKKILSVDKFSAYKVLKRLKF